MMEPSENPGNFSGKTQERDTRRPTRAGKMGNYVARDDYGEEYAFTAPDSGRAMLAAQGWVREIAPDVPPEEGTTWETVYLESPDGMVTTVTVPIDPEEPYCAMAGPHRWGPAQAFGHGGGVVAEERCDRCGLSRITDTWAQNPETGQQGLRSVRYVRWEPLEED